MRYLRTLYFTDEVRTWSENIPASITMRIKLWRTLKILLGLLFALLCIFQVINHSKDVLRDQPLPHNGTPALTLHNDKDVIHYIADYLDVKFDVGSNGDAPEIWLTNTGTASIKGGNWHIYYNHYNEYKGRHFQQKDTNTNALVEDRGLYIFNVVGYLYRIQPKGETFDPIKPGERRVIHFSIESRKAPFHLICPNWYVTSDNVTGSDVKPRVIFSTIGRDLNFVGNFKVSRTNKRLTEETIAKERYLKNEENIGHAKLTEMHVIPSPKHMTIRHHKAIHIDSKGWIINTLGDFMEEARFLSDKLGISIARQTVDNNSIIITSPNDENMGAEEYKLLVERDKSFVTIIASHKPGAFYGVQTLLSLISNSSNGHYIVPECEITDKPRFEYRGLHLDVARNFMPKKAIIRLLDAMAMYKLNRFHFHLSDDEGWRLQIPGLPELTEFSSKRCHDPSGEHCLMPQHGSGPFSSSGFGSGYYTVDDYKEILAFAKSRHIKVIPEFDLPGHARAAIKAMEFRKKHNKDDSFVLSEPEDRSQYKTIQNYRDTVINVCIKSTYRFVNHLFRKLEIIHNDTQPLSFYHVGLDEIPKGVWTSSPACRHLVKKENVRDLKLYFIKTLLEVFRQNPIDIGFWEDGLFQNKMNVYPMDSLWGGSKKRNTVAYVWNHIPAISNTADRAISLLKAGYKLVVSTATHLYLDMKYEDLPEERGTDWASKATSTYDVFTYQPLNIVQRETTIWSRRRETALPIENIIGMQAHLWTEMVHNPDEMFYMLFPRLLAVAERAWHKASWEDSKFNNSPNYIKKDWLKFATTVATKELKRLDELNVKYRVPLPGVLTEKGLLKANTEFPGLPIEYSEDHGETWTELDHRGITKVESAEAVLIRVLTADRRRPSQQISAGNSCRTFSLYTYAFFTSSILLMFYYLYYKKTN